MTGLYVCSKSNEFLLSCIHVKSIGRPYSIENHRADALLWYSQVHTFYPQADAAVHITQSAPVKKDTVMPYVSQQIEHAMPPRPSRRTVRPNYQEMEEVNPPSLMLLLRTTEPSHFSGVFSLKPVVPAP